MNYIDSKPNLAPYSVSCYLRTVSPLLQHFQSEAMFYKQFVFATAAASLCHAQLDAIPDGFDAQRWAWVSNQDPLLAVIPGHFNRSNFDAPSAAKVSDEKVAAM